MPGVIYGHDRHAEAVAIDTLALNKMLIGISAGTTVFDVVVDGRPAVKALIREIQRDSVRPAEILHLDLYEVRADEKVTLVGADPPDRHSRRRAELRRRARPRRSASWRSRCFRPTSPSTSSST